VCECVCVCVCMCGEGLSKQADAATVRGLVYNAFDDIQARMHGTQMMERGGLFVFKQGSFVFCVIGFFCVLVGLVRV
jgi:hypothetical protein